MRVLLCVVLFAVATVAAQQEDYAFPDYWQNDYDTLYDNYKDVDDSNYNIELDQVQTSKPTDDVIPNLEADREAHNEDEDKNLDILTDYQIEDNRSNSVEKEQIEENIEVAAAESIPEDARESEINEDLTDLPLEEPINNDFNDHSNKDIGKIEEAEPLLTPSTDNNQAILEETKNILNNDSQGFDDEKAKESVSEVNPESFVNSAEIDRVIEETNKLLQEGNDNFEADYDGQEKEKSDEELYNENSEEYGEDTPEKVYKDLNADLDKLFETLDKLSNDNSDDESEKNADGENLYDHNVKDYEEKYGRPFNEKVALAWREAEANDFDYQFNNADYDETVDNRDVDDYESINDSNLSDIFEAKISDNGNQLSEAVENKQLSENIDENSDNIIDETLQIDKNKTDVTPVEKDIANETIDHVENFEETLYKEPNADDDINNALRDMFVNDINEPQSYGNDALVDENQPKNEDAAEFESIEANNTEIEENIEQKSIMVDELSSAELSDLMSQFAIAHSEDLDVNSKSFSRDVAPIHVTLSVDEPTVITSPNYPEPYPTNNIVDWIFEGPGTGIELNITNFAVNGAIGDYLLVKPGGIDDSGSDGLIFSYRLNKERRYRFADVNRMFVRFEAKPGWQFMTGFSFSVKMIWPLSTSASDLDIPEPEAVVQPPQETLTLNLAGLTVTQFTDIREDFLNLIADMATAYIKDNNINPGMNTTLEVTQITRTAICNIRWPDYETCVEVTFGVPLQYEGDVEEPRLSAEDLDAMWTGYIIKENYAERLRSLGITEYAIPNDRTVLMVWLVIAAGVLISMAMLAFALWRFSCFEDYTRMQAYSDTDSLKNEKRHLDLYPTPHQTLPPLYSENDYKWADEKYDDSTRVDMGGFANKSYVRDELFDLDSDEDAITTRDRKGVISPRDIYDV